MLRTSVAVVLLLPLLFGGCASTPEPPKDGTEVAWAVAKFRNEDPTLGKWFDESYAYAVFPLVREGALIIGGAGGAGYVVEGGDVVGKATIRQASVGVQAGVQRFAELIFFKNKETLDRFKSGRFQFSSQMTVAVAKLGEGAKSMYIDGLAVFVKPEGGLMFEASIGGQRFFFEPADSAHTVTPDEPAKSAPPR